jgi:hypothetical protein
MAFHQAKTKRLRKSRPEKSGFTLLEALVTIGLAVIVLSIYTSMLTAVYYISRSQYGIQATGFVQEGLDVLHTIDYDELLNRTNGNLLGLSFTRGVWSVTSDKTLQMSVPTTAWSQETGLAVLPGNYRNDFTFTADVRALNASPSGWGAGIAFRYRDSENHYRFRFSSGGIAFDKVYQGTVTTLWSQSSTYSKDTWYTLSVTASANQFILKRNGVTVSTWTDDTYTTGDLALLTLNSAIADFDNVSVTGDGAGTWNFNGETNGTYPDEWRRFGPFDLPAGLATLTLSDYLGLPDLKQATVTVSWGEAGITRSATGSSIITR